MNDTVIPPKFTVNSLGTLPFHSVTAAITFLSFEYVIIMLLPSTIYAPEFAEVFVIPSMKVPSSLKVKPPPEYAEPNEGGAELWLLLFTVYSRNNNFTVIIRRF